MNKTFELDTSVPHFGRIKAVKRGEMEYEYLLVKAGVVTWLSHSDIQALLKTAPSEQQKE